jgi:hypothetical protein
MDQNKTIRLLTVSFDFEITPSEINQFRGAVIKTTQGKNDLFHNHSPVGNLYRYPKIQYKALNKKAALICIEEGIEGMQDFFSHTDWKLQIGSDRKEIKVDEIKVNQHRVGIWDRRFEYKITHWLPLNQDNYKKYHGFQGLSEKIQLLERILLANILSFLEGIDLFAKDRIEITIKSIPNETVLKYKSQPMQAFTVVFQTNVSLPNNMGLGKGSSVGFGVIKEIINNKTNKVYEQ